MRFTFLLPLLAFIFSGCAGYTLGPIKPKLMRNVQTIAVPMLKNETLEPRLEVQVTNAIIQQLQLDGTYRVARENNADAILEGTIVEMERRPARSVAGNVLRTREYVLTLQVRYRLYERATGRELFSRVVTGNTNFFVSGISLVADVRGDEQQAIPLAAEELAVRTVSQISEGW